MKVGFANFNIMFKGSITDNDIESFKTATQHLSDCYLMSTIETLAQTQNGRKILKNQIERDDNNPNQINCYFLFTNGRSRKVFSACG